MERRGTKLGVKVSGNELNAAEIYHLKNPYADKEQCSLKH